MRHPANVFLTKWCMKILLLLWRSKLKRFVFESYSAKSSIKNGGIISCMNKSCSIIIVNILSNTKSTTKTKEVCCKFTVYLWLELLGAPLYQKTIDFMLIVAGFLLADMELLGRIIYIVRFMQCISIANRAGWDMAFFIASLDNFYLVSFWQGWTTLGKLGVVDTMDRCRWTIKGLQPLMRE